MDVGELLWFGVLLSPHRLTLDGEREHELGPALGLADIHCCPFTDGQHGCWEELSNISSPAEGGDNVDSF